MKQPVAVGKIRIIGGSLRGSKLSVLPAHGLRPTPDRVRETLFNWLMPVIGGARCLDLFAGTGALGIEALSRGAGWVDFAERDRQIAQSLQLDLARLHQTQCAVRTMDALQMLAEKPTASYDIVFADPPFESALWQPAAAALEANAWLRDDAWIYLEMPVSAQPALPANWTLHRESAAGAVRYVLYRRRGASAKL